MVFCSLLCILVMLLCCFIFFFFKQKTAYEVRISDWSSDVCSSDLEGVETGVMHACGHDTHMTAWIGVARLMAANKNGWSGTLVMIGQPAEERGAGARMMLADGLYTRFPKPEYVLAFHDAAQFPAGKIGYTPGYALANVDSVDILVKGVGGHGAYPQATKDPIVLGSRIVGALQTLVSREVSPLDSAVVTVGSFHAEIGRAQV